MLRWSYTISKKKIHGNNLYEEVDENCSKEEIEFKRNTFYVILDSVICGMKRIFAAVSDINESFSFLWLSKEDELNAAAKTFLKKYTL